MSIGYHGDSGVMNDVKQLKVDVIFRHTESTTTVMIRLMKAIGLKYVDKHAADDRSRTAAPTITDIHCHYHGQPRHY